MDNEIYDGVSVSTITEEDIRRAWAEKYQGLIEDAMSKPTYAERVKFFYESMRSRIEWTSRDIAKTLDINTLQMARGQISICIELADWANKALEAEEAKAKADAAKGIPESLR